MKSATKMAEVEIRRFHQQRLGEMKESLIAYTEGQIRVAKDAHQRLAMCVTKMKQFELPRKLESSAVVNPNTDNIQHSSSHIIHPEGINNPE